jgi:hypothetical protein
MALVWYIGQVLLPGVSCTGDIAFRETFETGSQARMAQLLVTTEWVPIDYSQAGGLEAGIKREGAISWIEESMDHRPPTTFCNVCKKSALSEL